MRKAVAIDLGASSARFAVGWQGPDGIAAEVVEQIPHAPVRRNGHDVWDIDALLGLCRRALDYARREGAVSIGIDTWGVDHGFVRPDGSLIQAPVAYRDASHQAAFERMAEHRSWLYAQTGIQHQPFNTLYQLIARHEAQPELFEHGVRWLLLPDLLLHLLGGEAGYERSIASTTQLTGFDGNWNRAVFERFRFPAPDLPVSAPGPAGEVDGVRLMRVAGHDTACAVDGLGVGPSSSERTVFANLGTWALIGVVTARPADLSWAAEHNLTHEQTPWGDFRLLTNVPGFFILDRLHAELGVEVPMGAWLEQADLAREERIDAFDPALFAPESMVEAVSAQLGCSSLSREDWAGVALLSLVETLADRAKLLQADRLRISGGGSRSARLCQLLADRAGVPVEVGPSEATVAGNLAIQLAFDADGRLDPEVAARRVAGQPTTLRTYVPGGRI